MPKDVKPTFWHKNETVLSNGTNGSILEDQNYNDKISIKDFELCKVLGRGFIGKVTLCKKKDTGKLYAIKSIHKDQILELNL